MRENYALQLKISLNNIKPLIWRRIVVNSDIGLEELSDYIETVMPWGGGHLHKFYNKHQTYLVPYDDDDLSPEEEEQMEAYEDAILEDILTEKGQRLRYVYDFGDDWVHDIVVEAILPQLEFGCDVKFITGKNAAPPDGCGGIGGYVHLREVMSNPKHPEYEEMVEWLELEDGRDFDPTNMGFTAEEFNKMLEDDFGDDDFDCISSNIIDIEGDDSDKGCILGAKNTEMLHFMLENNMIPLEGKKELLKTIEENYNIIISRMEREYDRIRKLLTE